jgi:predicted small lipoprotein YifL
MRILLSLIALVMALAACGSKGPLYLPKPKPGAQKPAAPPAPGQEQPPMDAERNQ